eukprot:Pgem_evm1s12706
MNIENLIIEKYETIDEYRSNLLTQFPPTKRSDILRRPQPLPPTNDLVLTELNLNKSRIRIPYYCIASSVNDVVNLSSSESEDDKFELQDNNNDNNKYESINSTSIDIDGCDELNHLSLRLGSKSSSINDRKSYPHDVNFSLIRAKSHSHSMNCL